MESTELYVPTYRRRPMESNIRNIYTCKGPCQISYWSISVAAFVSRNTVNHRCYTEFTNNTRVFNVVQSGWHWQMLQAEIPKTGILAPLVVSSDATLLSEFGMEQDIYPFYITTLAIPTMSEDKCRHLLGNCFA